MKRFGKLILFSGLLVACLGGYFLVSHLWQEDQTAAEPEYLLGDDDVASMEWEYQGESYSLTLKEGEWVYDADPSCPVDQSAAEDLADALLKTNWKRSFSPEGGLKEYGLAEPEMSLVVLSSSGKEIPVRVGNENAMTGEYYLLLGEEETVYCADTNLLSYFCCGILDLVKKEDIPYIESFDSILLSRQETTLEILSGEDTAQVQYQGEEYALTEEALTALESFLSGMSFAACVDYNASEEELLSYGLDEGSAWLASVDYTEAYIVSTNEQDEDGNDITKEIEEEHTFQLLAGAEAGDYFYVRLPGSSMVYLMDLSGLSSLLSDPESAFV